MVRDFTDEPVDPDLIDRLLADALRAPSAGNSQGTEFVVLEGPDTARYWDVTLAPERREGFAWPGLLRATVLVLPLAGEERYVARYGEPDKAATGLGAGADRWAVPYWTVDCAFATMTLLHGVVDAGLGALFFGVFDHEDAVCDALGIPDHLRPIGAVAIGHPAGESRAGRSAGRARRPVDEVVHRGRWGAGPSR